VSGWRQKLYGSFYYCPDKSASTVCCFSTASRAYWGDSCHIILPVNLLHTQTRHKVTFSVPLASGIFLSGAASGGLLVYIRWKAVAKQVREEMTGELEAALHAKRRVEQRDCGYEARSTGESMKIRKTIEQRKMEIDQIRAEIDALQTVIQLLEDPNATHGRYVHTGAAASRA